MRRSQAEATTIAAAAECVYPTAVAPEAAAAPTGGVCALAPQRVLAEATCRRLGLNAASRGSGSGGGGGCGRSPGRRIGVSRSKSLLEFGRANSGANRNAVALQPRPARATGCAPPPGNERAPAAAAAELFRATAAASNADEINIDACGCTARDDYNYYHSRHYYDYHLRRRWQSAAARLRCGGGCWRDGDGGGRRGAAAAAPQATERSSSTGSAANAAAENKCKTRSRLDASAGKWPVAANCNFNQCNSLVSNQFNTCERREQTMAPSECLQRSRCKFTTATTTPSSVAPSDLAVECAHKQHQRLCNIYCTLRRTASTSQAAAANTSGCAKHRLQKHAAATEFSLATSNHLHLAARCAHQLPARPRSICCQRTRQRLLAAAPPPTASSHGAETSCLATTTTVAATTTTPTTPAAAAASTSKLSHESFLSTSVSSLQLSESSSSLSSFVPFEVNSFLAAKLLSSDFESSSVASSASSVLSRSPSYLSASASSSCCSLSPLPTAKHHLLDDTHLVAKFNCDQPQQQRRQILAHNTHTDLNNRSNGTFASHLAAAGCDCRQAAAAAAPTNAKAKSVEMERLKKMQANDFVPSRPAPSSARGNSTGASIYANAENSNSVAPASGQRRFETLSESVQRQEAAPIVSPHYSISVPKFYPNNTQLEDLNKCHTNLASFCPRLSRALDSSLSLFSACWSPFLQSSGSKLRRHELKAAAAAANEKSKCPDGSQNGLHQQVAVAAKTQPSRKLSFPRPESLLRFGSKTNLESPLVIVGAAALWLSLQLAGAIASQHLRKKLNRMLEKSVAQVNSFFMDHNLMLGVINVGSLLSKTRLEIPMVYFDTSQCREQIESIISIDSQKDADGNSDKRALDYSKIGLPLTKSNVVAFTQSLARKIILRFSQRWISYFDKQKLVFFDDDDEVKPRHLSSGKCLCQFIEEHFDSGAAASLSATKRGAAWEQTKSKKKSTRTKEEAACVEIFESKKVVGLERGKEQNGVSSLIAAANCATRSQSDTLGQDSCKEELINRLRLLLETRIGEVDRDTYTEVQ